MERLVVATEDKANYCKSPPFFPSEKYPEWPNMPISEEDNPAFRAVRDLLFHLGLDSANYGHPSWNPLGVLIHPGETVMLKPNLVSHADHRANRAIDIESLITHGSVIRVVADYTAKALQGSGRIIIGDCPIQGADWEQLIAQSGLNEVIAYLCQTYPNLSILLKDYRLAKSTFRHGVRYCMGLMTNDPNYVEVDLRDNSALLPLMQGDYHFGVAQYPRWRMKRAHTPTTNCYLIHEDFLNADVFINIPKMKSHKKAGISCALKNLVGIVGHKDYLPHFRFGSPRYGGDEYPDGNWLWDVMWAFVHLSWDIPNSLLSALFERFGQLCAALLVLGGLPRHTISSLGSGGWYGNDILWRTILDINRAWFYYDRQAGQVVKQIKEPRRYLAILDGLVGGSKESPLSPTPVQSGLMLASQNPVALDAVAAALMGFDISRIPQIIEAFNVKVLPLAHFTQEEIEIRGSLPASSIREIYQTKCFRSFQPSMGNKDHLEYPLQQGSS